MAAVDVEKPLANGLANGHAAPADVEMNGVSNETTARFATGFILPPPDIKCEQRR